MNNSTSARLLCGALLLGAAQACSQTSDPASETPVEPEPGLYKITLSGAGLLKHANNDKTPETFCLTEIQRASFPHLLAENYYKLHYACTNARAPRMGNAIGGEISCAADPKMASGVNRFIYDGVVSREKTSIEVRMKMDAELNPGAGGAEVSDAQMKMAMKTMERMRFVIEATRTGDCG